MDIPAVRRKLRRALTLQHRSALQYQLAAQGGRGIQALALSSELQAFADAEFADAGLLVSRLVALGGEPNTTLEPLEYAADATEALDLLIRTEEEALEALHAIIPDTGQEPGSEALEHLAEHLIHRKQKQLDLLLRARDADVKEGGG